jgi:hypothetical protein
MTLVSSGNSIKLSKHLSKRARGARLILRRCLPRITREIRASKAFLLGHPPTGWLSCALRLPNDLAVDLGRVSDFEIEVR